MAKIVRTQTHTENAAKASSAKSPYWVELSAYNSSYYSGLDVSYYFGGIYIEEMVNFAYQEMEMLRPNFGYHSYTFRSVDHGTRIVQGSFTINFTEEGYMPKLLAQLGVETDYGVASDIDTLAETTKDVADIRQKALKSDLSMQDMVNLRNADPQTWSALMDALDSAFWGEKTTLSNGYTVDERALQSANEAFMARPKFYTSEDGFDIVLKFGQPDAESRDSADRVCRWGSLKTIKNCHISGPSVSVDDSGRPVMETYAFMASTVAH